ncbi:hypothetical protein [uncultured Methanoregula sp.]|uniref:hypothetical protein n=1 Tax=uncultured Methanoregula sp. TaxID=1005933 RepID=UPI002AAB833B|nr:hypothetical protein [uncultured Methanoregula sp.]
MKINLYLISFLVLLAVIAVVPPVLAYNCACNCTDRNMTIVSDANTSVTSYPATPWSIWYPAVPANFPSSNVWGPVTSSMTGSPTPRWIWRYNTAVAQPNDGRFVFRRNFSFNNSCCWPVVNATMKISADDTFSFYLNNQLIGSGSSIPTVLSMPYTQPWSAPQVYTFPVSLHDGFNQINITAQNYGMPFHLTPSNAGVIYRLNISYIDCCPGNGTIFNPALPHLYAGFCGNSNLEDSSQAISGISAAPTRVIPWPFSLFGGT